MLGHMPTTIAGLLVIVFDQTIIDLFVVLYYNRQIFINVSCDRCDCCPCFDKLGHHNISCNNIHKEEERND